MTALSSPYLATKALATRSHFDGALMRTESDKAPSKWDLSHVGVALRSAVQLARTRPPGTDLDALLSKQTMLTLEARDAEVQAANAVKGGVVPMQVTDWQARVPGRVGDHDPLNPEGLIAKPFVVKYGDDMPVMQHDKAVTLHHWHVVSVFDNKRLGNEAFWVQGVMIPNPAWDTGLPVCDLHGHNTPLDRVCSLHLCIPCLESQHIEMAVDFFTKQCVHHLAEYC